MRVLVAGWFSFPQMGATVGDLNTRDVACDWLRKSGITFDVALATPFNGGVDWRQVDPDRYSHMLFVCGPFGNGWPITEFLPRFEGLHLVGLNLSMLQSLDEWNPFDVLLERDSSRTARPDLAFLHESEFVPVVGVVLVEKPKEPRKHDRHVVVEQVIRTFLDEQDAPSVAIDTRLDENLTGLRNERQIESLIARMDIVITTRLHGTVYSIKNSVPPIVIDPIAGGAKITRQCKTIGWPVIFSAEEVSVEGLRDAFAYCSSEEARVKARECVSQAMALLDSLEVEFLDAFRV